MDSSTQVPPLISFDYMKSHQLSPSRDTDISVNHGVTTIPTNTNSTSGTTSNRKISKVQIEKSKPQPSSIDDEIDNDFNDNDDKKKNNISIANAINTTPIILTQKIPFMKSCLKIIQNKMIQKILSIPLSIVIFIIIKKVFLHHQSLEYFFTWMEKHPNKGMAAYLIIYPFHMLLFLPGTPLVMGAGYIFKLRFGWLWGVSLCSIITLFGSLIGSMMCFLLGRYCMRSSVRRWSKKYPLFDPIDAGESFFVLVRVS
jgi:hypothetical protein